MYVGKDKSQSLPKRQHFPMIYCFEWLFFLTGLDSPSFQMSGSVPYRSFSLHFNSSSCLYLPRIQTILTHLRCTIYNYRHFRYILILLLYTFPVFRRILTHMRLKYFKILRAKWKNVGRAWVWTSNRLIDSHYGLHYQCSIILYIVENLKMSGVIF